MTGKHRIIDDVDVSRCEYAMQGKYNTLCAGNEDSALCDVNKNCLYKNYKHKEKEYKDLEQTLFEICKDLKQTLFEIKEIAELFCNLCQEFEPENRKCMYCNYGKILQKISEVENEH